MSIDRLINLFVTITLIEMMVADGGQPRDDQGVREERTARHDPAPVRGRACRAAADLTLL
jgi:hypothetical protein